MLRLGVMRGGLAAFRTAAICSLLGPFLGCGQGIFTRSRAMADMDGAVSDVGGPPGDFSSDATSPDGGAADTIGDASLARSMTITAGKDGVLQLDEGIVTVRSMSFDQDVVVTIEATDSPTLGPVGASYRASLEPVGAHSRNAIQLALRLDAVTDASHDQFRLATYQVRAPVGLWTAAPGQQYNAVDHTLTADFTGLDKESITFALLRSCINNGVCSSRETCNANLCQ
jgi:hypothetical protein